MIVVPEQEFTIITYFVFIRNRMEMAEQEAIVVMQIRIHVVRVDLKKRSDADRSTLDANKILDMIFQLGIRRSIGESAVINKPVLDLADHLFFGHIAYPDNSDTLKHKFIQWHQLH